MSSTGKKLHHYVPRFYLNAWAEKKRVYCLQAGEIRRDIVRNLGAENYFYSLQELSPEDVNFLREFIKDSPLGLRDSHEELLRTLMVPFQAKRTLEALGLATSEKMAEINRAIIELNENLHTSIEDDFKPCECPLIRAVGQRLRGTSHPARCQASGASRSSPPAASSRNRRRDQVLDLSAW
jgi:hypothetical protein